jgi:hypothetical protein
MGSAFAPARIAEAAFWVCGAAGVLKSRQRAGGTNQGALSVRAADAAIAAVVVLLVRVMAAGIAIG